METMQWKEEDGLGAGGGRAGGAEEGEMEGSLLVVSLHNPQP